MNNLRQPKKIVVYVKIAPLPRLDDSTFKVTFKPIRPNLEHTLEKV
jgi:hypothetical protein